MSDEFNGRTRGADGHVRPVVVRSFKNLTQAEFENAESRIYLGIHWAFDRDEGIKQGEKVADYVFDNVLQPNSHLLGQRLIVASPEGESGGMNPSAADIALMLINNDANGAGLTNRRRGG